MHKFNNAQVATALREVATALNLKHANLFQIRAYEGAATSIEHSTEEISDLWEEGRLDQIPGIGESLKDHLDELFKKGQVKHWQNIKKGIPKAVFELIDVPGIGPKTALRLAKSGVKSIKDLQLQLRSGRLIKKGFSAKALARIGEGIGEEEVKSGRMLLPYAFAQSEKILNLLKKCPNVEQADVLGSLRRRVATIGDLDFSVSSKEPEKAVSQIIKLPGVAEVVEKGEAKVTIVLVSGLHLDFLISSPSSYGALLQHFTGSKSHNIHLRTLAEKKGYSLSEHGVKQVKSSQLILTEKEEELYKILGMQTPSPEIREDMGEIEAALKHKLPELIELADIKGDLHTHSNFPIEPSHDSGNNSVEEMAKYAHSLGYGYLGIADHSPSTSNHTNDQIIALIAKRKKEIEQINYSQSKVRVLNLLEVDIQPDGTLSVPNDGLRLLDFAIAGVHSVHRLPKDKMTRRILKALENPFVKVLSHPTGRLLNERGSYETDWDEIFKFAAKNKKALEINAYPNRLDLPDNLIRRAKEYGVKFVINTDSHAKEQLVNMKFGVFNARRGWATSADIVNSWEWKKFKEWFKIDG